MAHVDFMQSLKCPSCGAPLERQDGPTLKCPYCRTSVFVPDLVRQAQLGAPVRRQSKAPMKQLPQIAAENEDEDEDLLGQAIKLVRGLESVSASILQRRLRIGYPRAARLLDELEEAGVVGPSQGGGREREVLPASAVAPVHKPLRPIFEQDGADTNDPLLGEAIRLVRGRDFVLTTFLQRVFRIGYTRAAHLLEELEERRIVGPAEGAGGERRVLQ